MSGGVSLILLLVGGYKRRGYGEFSALTADGEPSQPSTKVNDDITCGGGGSL